MKQPFLRMICSNAARGKVLFLNKRILTSRSIIALSAISLIALATGAGASRGNKAHTESKSKPRAETNAAKPPPSVASPQGQADGEIRVKLVTLTPDGFEPEEVVASQRRFLLAVDNLSQLDEVFLSLKRVTGDKLHDVRMPIGRRNLSKMVELTPGDYVLTETNHPRWVCRITVRPH